MTESRRWAGHSHWHNIKHKKASNDAKRASQYVKLSNEIVAAIRAGGGDTSDANIRLQSVLSKAKAMNMPKDRIEVALKGAAGKKDAAANAAEDVLYEARTASNISLLIEALTDNRKRTAPQIRAILSKYGASLLNPNSLTRFFNRVGLVVVRIGGPHGSEAEVTDKILQVDGVENFEVIDSEHGEVVCAPNDLRAVTSRLLELGCSLETFEIVYLPEETTEVDAVTQNDKGHTPLDLLRKLLDEFEDHPEVQRVTTNCSNID